MKASSSEEDANGTATATGAGRGRRGRLHAPTHTLPPDTTCTWTFHGRPGESSTIFDTDASTIRPVRNRSTFSSQEISFGYTSRATRSTLSSSNGASILPTVEASASRPRSAPRPPADRTSVARRRSRLGRVCERCCDRGRPSPSRRPRRRIRPPRRTPPARPCCAFGTEEGRANRRRVTVFGRRIFSESRRERFPVSVQARLLGRYCGGPVVCARASLANATRSPRACGAGESYLSSGSLLALAVRTVPGTATHPLRFSLHYEFVDTQLGGNAPSPELASMTARAHPSECARVFTEAGAVLSPRNVLWFGRGGARRLRCVYRVQAAADERVVLSLLAAAFGRDPSCATRPHPDTGR